MLLKRFLILFLISLLFVIPSTVQAKIVDKRTIDKSRVRLTKLLKERSEKFDKYTKSIDERSGIFGNQTKKDLRRVNDILIEITQTDNVIFNELKRLLDYRSFEKGNAVLSAGRYEEERENYIAAIDTLNKQVMALKGRNIDLEQENSYRGFWFWVMGLVLVVLLWRRKKALKGVSQK